MTEPTQTIEKQNEYITTDDTRAYAPARPERAKPKKGILSDDSGAPSSMRLMSMIALFTSIGFGWVTITKDLISYNGIYITIGFLLAAFAPKALQKFAEVKIHDESA